MIVVIRDREKILSTTPLDNFLVMTTIVVTIVIIHNMIVLTKSLDYFLRVLKEHLSTPGSSITINFRATAKIDIWCYRQNIQLNYKIAITRLHHYCVLPHAMP